MIINIRRGTAIIGMVAMLVAGSGAAALAASGGGHGDPHHEQADGCDRGATGKPCKPDTQPDKGKDCVTHGNHGGVNEDHCNGTTPSTTTTGGTSSSTTTSASSSATSSGSPTTTPHVTRTWHPKPTQTWHPPTITHVTRTWTGTTRPTPVATQTPVKPAAAAAPNPKVDVPSGTLAYTGFNWALFSIAAALAILGLAAYYVRRRLTS